MSVVFALILAQADDLGERLMAGRWAAVEKADPKDKAALEALAKSEDKDLQWWAGAALAELDAREKAGPSWVEPLRVSLESNKRPSSEVLDGLLGKAGLKLLERPAQERPVTVSLKNATLLDGLDEACRRADLAWEPVGTRWIRLTGPAPRRAPAWHAGVFGVRVLGKRRELEATFDGAPTSRLTLHVDLLADPRVRIGRAEFKAVSAIDDLGRSLLLERGPEDDDGDGDFLGDSPEAAGRPIALKAPGAGATRIASLRAVASVRVFHPAEIVFDNVRHAGGQEKKLGPVTARLGPCTRDGGNWDLRLQVEVSEGAFRWDMNELVLEDAAGKCFPSLGRGVFEFESGASKSASTLSFEPREGLGDPDKLTFSFALHSYRREVWFEMKDIPLE